MNDSTKELLQKWAKEYNTTFFIQDDPVQFPHRFTDRRDIEISAFLTSWLSYGNRTLIIRKVEELHQLMGDSPYAWLMRKGYDSPMDTGLSFRDRAGCFYRFYKWTDLHDLCVRLNHIYSSYATLEEALLDLKASSPIQALRVLFDTVKGVPSSDNSACKRLAMFLRWMVRDDGIVDFGLWKAIACPRDLLIPLDTHVHKMALELKLTRQKSALLKTAREITESLAEVFPDDPCLGDFALFGYGVNRNSK